MAQSKRRPRRSRDQIRDLVRECKEGSHSVTRFARDRGIDPSTMRLWIRREKAAQTKPSRSVAEQKIVPVEVRTPTSSPTLLIELRSGHSIRVAAGFDPEALTQVLDLLDRRC